MKRLLTNTLLYALVISACEVLVGTYFEIQLLLGYAISIIVSIALLTFLLSFRPREPFSTRFARAFMITSIAALIITGLTLGAELIKSPDYFDLVRQEASSEQNLAEAGEQPIEEGSASEEVFDILLSPGFIVVITVLLYFVTGFFVSLIVAGITGISTKEHQDQVFDEHIHQDPIQ